MFLLEKSRHFCRTSVQKTLKKLSSSTSVFLMENHRDAYSSSLSLTLCWIWDLKRKRVNQSIKNSTKMNSGTFIIWIAILTVQFVVSHSYISASGAITQLDMANYATETSQMIKQPQAFNDHSCASTWKKVKNTVWKIQEFTLTKF